MRELADLHIHALYGTDDGPEKSETSLLILDKAYAEGTRTICFTPHCHPAYYGDNRKKIQEAFLHVSEAAEKKYPEMKLYLGTELYFEKSFRERIAEGSCLTLGNTRCILTDFAFSESASAISDAMSGILNAGYVPILAHAEKYPALFKSRETLSRLRQNGVIIQTDASSLLGEEGLRVRRRARSMIENHTVDFVSSDAHGISDRSWRLGEAFDHIEKHYGIEKAERLCCTAALEILDTYRSEE